MVGLPSHPRLQDLLRGALAALLAGQDRLRRGTLEHVRWLLESRASESAGEMPEPGSAAQPKVLDIALPPAAGGGAPQHSSPGVNPGSQRKLRVPLLGLVPAPSLALRQATVQFEQQIMWIASDGSGVSLSGPIAARAGQRRASRLAAISVRLTVRDAQTPEGALKLNAAMRWRARPAERRLNLADANGEVPAPPAAGTESADRR